MYQINRLDGELSKKDLEELDAYLRSQGCDPDAPWEDDDDEEDENKESEEKQEEK